MSAPYSIEEMIAMADEMIAPISAEGIAARDEYLEASKQIKALEEKRKKCAKILTEEAASKNAIKLADHEFSMFEIVSVNRASVDTASMSEMYPEIVAEFTTVKKFTRIDVKK